MQLYHCVDIAAHDYSLNLQVQYSYLVAIKLVLIWVAFLSNMCLHGLHFENILKIIMKWEIFREEYHQYGPIFRK